MEGKKAAIVNELTQQIRAFEAQQDLKQIKLEMLPWMIEERQLSEKKGPGRKPGSKNFPKLESEIDRHIVHHVLHVAEDGTPFFTEHKTKSSKPQAFIVNFRLACGANYIDGFNMPISKRMGNINYLKVKTPNSPGVCKHLNQCSGCYLLKTFDLIRSFDEVQPMAILRNEVAKIVQSGQYSSLINGC